MAVYGQLKHRAAELATAAAGVRHSIASALSGEVAHVVGLYRLEVRRTVAAIVLGLTCVFCVCGAVALGVFAVIAAFWETHRVLATALSAACLGLLALVCSLLMRSSTNPAASGS